MIDCDRVCKDRNVCVLELDSTVSSVSRTLVHELLFFCFVSNDKRYAFHSEITCRPNELKHVFPSHITGQQKGDRNLLISILTAQQCKAV